MLSVKRELRSAMIETGGRPECCRRMTPVASGHPVLGELPLVHIRMAMETLCRQPAELLKGNALRAFPEMA